MARPRHEVRRHPERGRYDRASVEAVLDATLVAHVAFVDDGQPFCIPMLQARVGETVYVHGSTASRTVRILGCGTPACLTVTALDGLVLARSAFEHSANYRSAVLLGSFSPVEDDAGRLAAFEAFTEKLVPGRWREVRPPDRRELKATTILSLAIGEAAVKVRSGSPSDGAAANGTWAGVVPIVTRFGEPEPAPELHAGTPLAASVRALLSRQ
jgi:nitroimidazol reductase NimA-like FMN-containing flavoprotein (pyridoxamine 5'-phosphate oxidase superfamily)